MVAVVLCAAFSGLAGFGLSLAMFEGWASGAGSGALALGVAGLVGVASAQARAA